MLEILFEDSLHPQVKTNGLCTVDRKMTANHTYIIE